MPVQAQKPDGSLQSIVHDAVNDPSTQAAFAHVMEAAATETKALSQLSGPATAPAPGVSHLHKSTDSTNMSMAEGLHCSHCKGLLQRRHTD